MDTSSQTTVPSPPDAMSGGGEIVEYRSLSVLAIVSLILGLLSPLALLAPLMLAVALFAAATAILALRQIASSDGMLAGRGAALVGLALCVASVGAFGSRALVTRQLLSSQADAIATEWIESLTSGHPEQALALTLESSVLPPTPESPPPQAREDDHEHADDHEHEHGSPALEHFLEIPLVKSLTALGAQARVRPGSPAEVTLGYRGVATVVRLYTILPADSGRESVEALLTAQRAKNEGEDRFHWLIIDFKPVDQANSQLGG